MIQKLSREEFKEALIKGHGRAVMHVKQYGLDGVDDILLNACLHNITFSTQETSSRSSWLLDMFKSTPYYNGFAEQIFTALENVSIPDDHYYDTEQLCELSADMALQGNTKASQLLWHKAKQLFDEGEELCGSNFDAVISALIDIDDCKAYIWIVQELGKQFIKLQSTPEKIRSILIGLEYLLHFKHKNTFKKVKSKLNYLQEQDKNITAFLIYEQLFIFDAQKHNKQKNRQEKDNTLLRKQQLSQILEGTFEQPILRHIDLGPGYPKHMDFGMCATRQEINSIFQHLLNETNEQGCHRLLTVLHSPKLPELHPYLFKLAQSKYTPLRNAAIRALTKFSAPIVGEFAREQIASNQLSDIEKCLLTDLFILNYQTGDEKQILKILKSIDQDIHEIHGSTYMGVAILEKNDLPDLLDIALWIYEVTPCEECRVSTVKWMCRQSLLPDAIREECLSDASADIRYLVSGFLDLARCENEKEKTSTLL